MTLIYGIGPVVEAIRAGRRRVHRVWIADSRGADRRIDELRTAARLARTAIVETPRDDIERRSRSTAHQGVLAEADPLPRVELGDLVRASADGAPPLVVVLDGVQDPQNLGSILRTAECAGVKGVIIPKDRAASLTPAAVKVAEGAVEHVALVEVTNLTRAIEELKQLGLWISGFEAEAGKTLFDLDLRGPKVLVLGSEGQGLRRLVREACDDLASIPLLGRIPSLNVSAAAAVVLYEAVRQRRAPPAGAVAGSMPTRA